MPKCEYWKCDRTAVTVVDIPIPSDEYPDATASSHLCQRHADEYGGVTASRFPKPAAFYVRPGSKGRTVEVAMERDGQTTAFVLAPDDAVALAALLAEATAEIAPPTTTSDLRVAADYLRSVGRVLLHEELILSGRRIVRLWDGLQWRTVADEPVEGGGAISGGAA